MVTLEAVPLTELAKGVAVVRERVQQKAQVLYAELGDNVLKSGRWTNEMGQIGFYANLAAIKMLSTTGAAKSFRLDVTGKGRAAAFSEDGSLDAIEEAFHSSTKVLVDLVLNADGPPYELLKDGATRYLGTVDFSGLKRSLQLEPFSAGMKLIDSGDIPVSGPVVSAELDREAFYGLKESQLVRAIRLKGFKDRRAVNWPEKALLAAQKHGYADVSISLFGGELYSARPSNMSENARRYQAEANTRALREILSAADIAMPALSEADAFQGVAIARLSQDQINKLFDQRDPRVLSVDLNKAILSSAFLTQRAL